MPARASAALAGGCLLDAPRSGRYASGDPAESPSAGFHTMPESEIATLPSAAGNVLKRMILAVQDYSLLSLQSLVNIFTPPTYWSDTLQQMDIIGVGSLPIIVMASLSIGGVLVLNTASQFQRFGMTDLTGDAVALALVRELGPTIAALLVAGRNASGMASELGSMIVTEQVDAMRALGTDPIRKLMTPRVVATLLMMPLLVAVFDFVGLIGGFAAAYFTLRLGAVQFWTRAIDALEFGDLVQGFTKPIVFAFIVSTIGCFKGLRVKGGTQGVGRATTSAVVISSVMVLVSDLFLAKLLLYIFR
ncbi:MAG: ABC transporter permease [Candidatus Acidiferrales bacterium]|jgi:phospholipid/cholesterol/gamma-HCH transport system permease protein